MKYRLVSVLTPAQIQARIGVYARPKTWFWRTISDALFYEILADDRFLLTKTGAFWVTWEYFPFHGRLTEENGKTVITGRFRPQKVGAVLLALPFLWPIVGVLFARDPVVPLVLLLFAGHFGCSTAYFCGKQGWQCCNLLKRICSAEAEAVE